MVAMKVVWSQLGKVVVVDGPGMVDGVGAYGGDRGAPYG